MELKHYLNNIEIDEPIGFDDIKMTMKRGDYHGMSAEFSEATLEFYGAAADIIRRAYQEDIDTEITYRITSDGTELYTGVLDLTTYEEQYSDYCSVSCKVGEVGIKTTFNVRSDVEVDLNSNKTLDGGSTSPYEWTVLQLPSRKIKYINKSEQKTTRTYTQSPETGNILELPDDFRSAFLNITLDTLSNNEFGSVAPVFHIAQIQAIQKDNPNKNLTDYFEPFYRSSEESSNYDGSTVNINVVLSLDLSFDGAIFSNGDNQLLTVNACIVLNGTNYYKVDTDVTFTNDTRGREIRFVATGLKTTFKNVGTMYVGLLITNNNAGGSGYFNNPAKFRVKINQGSYIEMVFLSELTNAIKTPTLFVHEALNKVTQMYSDNVLSVKSDLYSRADSFVNNRPGDGDINDYSNWFGEGALKVITNGYKIRGIFDTERNMTVSFKSLIESLDAMDCIGWGFSEENGKLYIRVERWDWFYKTGTPLLSIAHPQEVKTAIDTSMIISELKIGYKKYATSEDIASIDSVMSERTFTTATKAISKAESRLCDFVADNYAIELTRRAAVTTNQEEEFKYDENIFVFSVSGEILDGQMMYGIGKDVNGGDLNKETYNAKISPARNAYHWINRLFCVPGLKPFECTAGTVNYNAFFTTLETSAYIFRAHDLVNDIPSYTIGGKGVLQNPENLTLRERYYTQYYEDGTPKPTNNDLIIPRIFKAETITFTYPITPAEYRSIKADPYRLIEVDGVLGWIKEFSYSFVTGEATFKLIPKAE